MRMSEDQQLFFIAGLVDITPEELRTLYYLHGRETFKILILDLDAMYSS